MNILDKLKKVEELAYKSRFSIYYKPDKCILRVYYSDGKQHKEIASSLDEALNKMINFLAS